MKTPISDVTDLKVYQKAYEVSLALHKASLLFPQEEQYKGMADQVRRASKSICANLAEGFGKQSHSRAEFKRYISIAIGSADEMQVWLSYCKDLGYLPEATCRDYQAHYKTIAKMLSGLYKRWE
tara:strand:+ start:77 stop:448 length:372 start_codon:yes stop_codon:yes gene_type:complete